MAVNREIVNKMKELQDRLRMFLRDDAVLNNLIEGRESTPSHLREAIMDSLDDWNTTPPLISRVNFINHPSQRLLVRGAAIEVLRSAGILQSRNRLDYSDGGITVRDSDKAPDYRAWIANLIEDYENKKLRIKKSININGGYGEISSEYAYYGSYYDSGFGDSL